MKLYNRGSRVINPNTPIAIVPGKWSPELEEAEGKKLLKMFPRDLTASETDVEKINTEIAKLETENSKLAKENAALRDQLANFEKLVQSDSLLSGSDPLTPPVASRPPVVEIPKAPAAPAKKNR